MVFRRNPCTLGQSRHALIVLSWLALIAAADAAETDAWSADSTAPSLANCTNEPGACQWQRTASLPGSLSTHWMPVESSPPHGSSEQDGPGVVELGEQHNWQTYEFRRHEPLLEKLVRIRELRLLTLWQRDEIRLFIGIGRDGIAGLNLSTAKKKKRGSRNGSKRDLRPVVFDPYRDSRPSIP